jgi:hypothetical protein
MSAKTWSSRMALWVAVCTLLLKAAVPLLASASAQLQGKSVGEVCTVYGVVLPSTVHAHHHHHADGAGGPDHAPDHGSHEPGAHGDHCALTALAALAPPDMPQLALPRARQCDGIVPLPVFAGIRDACSLWVARMKQGPPAFA